MNNIKAAIETAHREQELECMTDREKAMLEQMKNKFLGYAQPHTHKSDLIFMRKRLNENVAAVEAMIKGAEE